MANLIPIETGLSMSIYISDKSGISHGTQLKVSKIYGGKIDKNSLFTITIDDEPLVIGNTGNIKLKDIELVKKFILINKSSLLDYWNKKIGLVILGSLIKKV
jgi:hypothetical protein